MKFTQEERLAFDSFFNTALASTINFVKDNSTNPFTLNSEKDAKVIIHTAKEYAIRMVKARKELFNGK